MKSNYTMCGREVEDPGLAGAVGTLKSPSMTMKMRRLRGFVVGSAAALLLLCPSPGKAQTFRGTILGTVTDLSGAAVSGASVTARNVDTGLERTTQTSDDGSYSIPELPLGM